MESKYSEYKYTYHPSCENPYFLEGKDKNGKWKLRFAVSTYEEAKAYLDNPELIEPAYKRLMRGGLIAISAIVILGAILYIHSLFS
jgi:hypothetical protein